MRIIAVDDEKIALEHIVEVLQEVCPDAEIKGFRRTEEVRSYVRENPADIAFLDIEMRGENGIELAKKLKSILPRINIIFTTGYEEYACEAWSLQASGYILKPVTRERVLSELEALRYPVEWKKQDGLRACTFGNFEIYYGNTPLKFKYSKSKEMLAYLIDRKGALCSNGELIAVLWEDEGESIHKASYLKNLRADIFNTLETYGCSDVLCKYRGQIGINREKIQCDYYDWLDGKISGINAYRGEYMEQYSWAEVTRGGLCLFCD